ncbi:MAG: hypothetical protein ACRECH_11015 [Nitrososphaerales archaeon]
MSENQLIRLHPEQFSKCQRCDNYIEIKKTPSVSYAGKKLYFCDKCFRAVFKFDKKLKPVGKIWEEGGKKLPFVVRKGSWHGSTYTVVKQIKESGEAGKKKTIFLGDLYLRGVLEKQDQPVGRSDAFIWVSWSEALAKEHKED